MNAKDIMERIEIEASAKTAKEVRFVRVMAAGEAVRQGDVYLVRLAGRPVSVGGMRTSQQVADGITVGARHCVTGAVRAYEYGGTADPRYGPVLDATERFELIHPEHDDYSMPGGWYQVEYQRDCAAEERARVMD